MIISRRGERSLSAADFFRPLLLLIRLNAEMEEDKYENSLKIIVYVLEQ